MGNIYLFYGDEKYDLEQKIEKIKKQFDNLEIGLNMFYITKENIDELENIIQSVTFFGAEKLILIKETNLKFNFELIDNLDKDITVIVIENNLDKRTSEYKKIIKIADCIEFKHMDERQIVEYIYNILKKCKLNISYKEAEYMQSICGEDKSNIINELQKIATFLNVGDTVTIEVIDSVCSKTLNAKIFDVLNLIVTKQKKKAIMELEDLIEQKEPIVKIYIMLYKQIKQMYMIKYLKCKKVIDIATELKINPYVFKKLSKTCDMYSIEKLKKIVSDFDVYDEKTKIGEMDFEIGLKKIICSI